MLLALYERAIHNITNAKMAKAQSDESAFARHLIDAQRTILAIHSGLKPDEHDIASNIARLLHFVVSCLQKYEFDDAIKTLSSLHGGFEAIREEANRLEQDGEIPPLANDQAYQTMV